MNVSVTAQTLEFLYSALLGVGIGILYDIFALIRSYLKKSRVITAVLDILFWICATVALFAFVMTISEGRMRWYVLVGTLGGTFIYKCTISALFFRSIRIIISILTKSLHLLVRPLYMLSDWLTNCGRKTRQKMIASRKTHRQKQVQKKALRQKAKECKKKTKKKKQKKQKKTDVK